MAIDTQDKRRSAYVGLGLYNIQPVPDGAQGTADRPHNRWIYRGIAIAGGGEPPVISGTYIPTYRPRRRG